MELRLVASGQRPGDRDVGHDVLWTVPAGWALVCRSKAVAVSDPISKLPEWHLVRLALLLDALDGVPLSYSETASLALLAREELVTIENLATVIRRARCCNR
jgi:hypothetical protein